MFDHNAPLHLVDFDIRFENGRTQDANVRSRLSAGQCTRAIDLRGNRRDTDTIHLPGRSRQSAVRLCSINAPLHLVDFDIRFENGRTQDANVRSRLSAGQCTRAIDLRGNRRDIERIRMRYEPIARNLRRPLVRVQVR